MQACANALELIVPTSANQFANPYAANQFANTCAIQFANQFANNCAYPKPNTNHVKDAVLIVTSSVTVSSGTT